MTFEETAEKMLASTVSSKLEQPWYLPETSLRRLREVLLRGEILLGSCGSRLVDSFDD